MKKIFILLLFVSSIITAQKKDFKYSLNGIKKVVLSSDTTIKFEVGTTNEFVITNKTSKDKNNHENHFPHPISKEKENKRKGLTAVYPGGKDDTNGYGFSITKEGTTLFISDLKSHFQRHGLNIKLPKNMNISVNSGNLGSIYMEGFTGEVEAQTSTGKIELKNVTGPITANTSVGKIDIDFDVVSQKSPITITSSVSEIDVALPANTKANLELTAVILTLAFSPVILCRTNII